MNDHQNDMDTAATISHPYAQYTAADAIELANSNRSLNTLPEVASFHEAREVVQEMLSRVGSNWITGMAALDVLDAALDNWDLNQTCRLM